MQQEASVPTFDEVGHVLEGARLLAMAVDGQGRARQRLRHKVADHAPVVQRHPWPVRVEDPYNTDLQCGRASKSPFYCHHQSPHL